MHVYFVFSGFNLAAVEIFLRAANKRLDISICVFLIFSEAGTSTEWTCFVDWLLGALRVLLRLKASISHLHVRVGTRE